MAGLIRGDELEIFHILRPEARVSGRVTKAYQLSSIAEVAEKDRERFHQVLGDIYEHVETSKDGSTEFVFAEKKFPLHMRENYAAVFLEGLKEGDAETIRSYCKDSSLLLSVANKHERYTHAALPSQSNAQDKHTTSMFTELGKWCMEV